MTTTNCVQCAPVLEQGAPPVLDIPFLDAALAPPAPAPKPPPQVLGVSGIAETPIVVHTPKINWAVAAALPPFQMFMAERDGPNQTGKNSQEWATDVALRLAGSVGDDILMSEYAVWHQQKGYWPGETHLGQPGGVR